MTWTWAIPAPRSERRIPASSRHGSWRPLLPGLRTIVWNCLPLRMGQAWWLPSKKRFRKSDGMSLLRFGFKIMWLLSCHSVFSSRRARFDEKSMWHGTKVSLQPAASEELRPSGQQPARDWWQPATTWVRQDVDMFAAELLDDHGSIWLIAASWGTQKLENSANLCLDSWHTETVKNKCAFSPQIYWGILDK